MPRRNIKRASRPCWPTQTASSPATFHQRTPITLAKVLNQIDLQTIVERIASAFRSIAGSTAQILIYVAFLLLEIRTFDRKLASMFPNTHREDAIRATLHQIGRKIETYVWIKTAVSLMAGLLSYAVLAGIGVDFAPFWALLLFILNFIPYIGPVIGDALADPPRLAPIRLRGDRPTRVRRYWPAFRP